jgi:competence protein ComEA
MLQLIGRGVAVAVIVALMSVPGGATEGGSVNLNTATAAELSSLKGIGDTKAQAIIAHREKNGAFKSVEDLKAVAGIGDKLVEQLRPQVTLGAAEKANEKPNDKSEPARKQ